MSSVGSWLSSIQCESYTEVFISNGYEDAESIAAMNEKDLLDIGVKNEDATKILKTIKEETQNNKGGGRARGETKNIVVPNESPVDNGEDEEVETDEEGGEDMAGEKEAFGCFLKKKGVKRFGKGFKKRYFRAYPNVPCISYFSNDKVTVETGRIIIKGALSVEELPSKGKQFDFAVTMKTSARVWTLRADSSEDRTKWIDFIKEHMATKEPVVYKSNHIFDDPPVVQNSVKIQQTKSSRHDPKESFNVEPHQFQDGETSIFLYGNKVAHIHEVREIELNEEKSVWISDLPKNIDSDSISFLSISNPETYVSQQRYYDDNKDQKELLQKLIGKKITVGAQHNKKFNDERTFSGIVNYNPKSDSYTLIDGKIVHFLNIDEAITFTLEEELEEELFYQSSINWIFNEKTENKQLITLGYSVNDCFKWDCSYNAVLNPTEDTLELISWINIKNLSNKTFKKVNLILSNDENPPKEEKKDDNEKEDTISLPGGGGGGFFSKFTGGLGNLASLAPGGKKSGDNKLRRYYYNIEDKVNLEADSPSGRKTQLRWTSSSNIKCKSLHLVTFDTPEYSRKRPDTNPSSGVKSSVNISTSIYFINNEENGLGLNLPSGKLNLFRKGKNNFGLEKLCDTQLSHYNSNDIIILPIEPIQDVSVSRSQTGFNYDIEKGLMVETIEITIVNSRLEPIDIVIEESLFRDSNWEITASNFEFNNSDHSRKCNWNIHCEPYSKPITLEYTAFYSNFNVPEEDKIALEKSKKQEKKDKK